jgi:hypothetical protein
MFGIKSISAILLSINATASKLNQTIHGSSESAMKTTEYIRSGSTAIMTAKGVKDCVVAYQCNDYICLTISGIGTIADLSTHICGNIPGLKKVTPLTAYMSVGCKSFVYMCRTGNITFSCTQLD